MPTKPNLTTKVLAELAFNMILTGEQICLFYKTALKKNYRYMKLILTHYSVIEVQAEVVGMVSGAMTCWDIHCLSTSDYLVAHVLEQCCHYTAI